MLCKLVTLLMVVTVARSQDCDWGNFFADAEAKCVSSLAEGIEVDCSKMLPSNGVVSVKCGPGLQLTGYKKYSCTSGSVTPRSYTSQCVSIDTPLCATPSGRAANNMAFLMDAEHQYDNLLENVDYHVSCKSGFMLKHGVDTSAAVGQCKYVNQRATIVATEECLPACEVRDNNQLHQSVPNLDRITIVYPSNTKKVADGRILHAKALCESEYGPLNQPVTLVCATTGMTAANSGYYLQQCEDGECVQCAENCVVPSVRGGTLFSRNRLLLIAESKSISSGEMTAYVDCEPGFNLVGNRFISCNEGSITSTVPTCSGAKVCSPPLVYHGITLPDESSSSSKKYTVKCDPGYTLGDPAQNTVNCDVNSDSSYSAVPTCFMGCAVPEVKNGEVRVHDLLGLQDLPQLSPDSAPYQTNATVIINCSLGYIYQGEGEVRCEVAGWTNLPQCLTEEELYNIGAVSGKKGAATGLFLAPILLAAAVFLH